MDFYTQLTRFTYDHFIPLGLIFSFIIGSCIGSFLNVCVWRIPRGESLSHPGSHCPKCNYEIPGYQNIPIIAWLVLRGKCKNCQEAISARYIIMEVAVGFIFVLLTYRAKIAGYPLSYLLTIYYLTASFIVITFIDIKHLIIPGRITWTGTLTAWCLALIFPYSIILPVDHPLVNLTIDQQWMAAQWSFLAANPRVFALLFSLSGFIVGYGIIWIVVESGKILFGKQTFKYNEPIGITITAAGAQTEGDELLTWGDMFDRKKDVLKIHIEEGFWAVGDKEGQFEPGIIEFNHDGFALEGNNYSLKDIKKIQLKSSTFVVPREAMGRGDIKMLAMIGAFLGPVGAIFTLMFATFAGCFLGVLGIALGKFGKEKQLPFGPYLAAAALFWMLFSQATITKYHSLIEHLSEWLRGG